METYVSKFDKINEIKWIRISISYYLTDFKDRNMGTMALFSALLGLLESTVRLILSCIKNLLVIHQSNPYKPWFHHERIFVCQYTLCHLIPVLILVYLHF